MNRPGPKTAVPAAAELVRWEVHSRQPCADGLPRGVAGVYEA